MDLKFASLSSRNESISELKCIELAVLVHGNLRVNNSVLRNKGQNRGVQARLEVLFHVQDLVEKIEGLQNHFARGSAATSHDTTQHFSDYFIVKYRYVFFFLFLQHHCLNQATIENNSVFT